jgi:hypothetical protein
MGAGNIGQAAAELVAQSDPAGALARP